MSNATFRGACLCGSVTFEADAPSLFCCHCHCAWCRAAHGAAFVTWVGVADAQFRITGDATLTWYQSTEQSRRGFCGRCGSTLFFASTLAPGEMHITRASIDGPIDLMPEAHVFVEHAVPWLPIDDDLPRVDGTTAKGLQAYAVIPARSRTKRD